MTTDMNIKQVDYHDLVLRFKHGEYVMSHVVQTRLNIRILRLETGDGGIGWGEIIRRGRFDDEAPPREEAILDALAGKPVSSIPVLLAKLRRDSDALRGLAFGLDTAFLDWTARRTGVPLYALLGGRRNDAVPDYYSLSGDNDASSTATTLNDEANGWAVVQIKLGVNGRAADIAMVEAAARCLSAQQLILADFNGALDVETALSMIAEFDDGRIVWEEPCETLDENNEVAARCGKPVMFDQCLADLATISGVAAAGLAHSVAIKPAFLGGLEVARAARDICVEAGMPVRIDGPWCGHIATAANLHLACGAPTGLLIAGCDLRQPLILDEDWGGTRHLPGHRIAPFDEPGHGVNPPPGVIPA
jgi:L-alanine-DL-glutamate epimerase-like enolase superfamily enzyme